MGPLVGTLGGYADMREPRRAPLNAGAPSHFRNSPSLGRFGNDYDQYRQNRTPRIEINQNRPLSLKTAGGQCRQLKRSFFTILISKISAHRGTEIFRRIMRPLMPRYYFHFCDGKRTFTDSIGVELTGIAAARSQVTAQIREMRGALSEHTLQDWSEWTMTVVNAKGKTVLEIDFDLALDR